MKSRLAKKDVLHVAGLAKLEVSPAEEKKFLSQLSEVIDYVGQLSQVGTQNVEPTSQTTGLEDIARNDEVVAGQVLSKSEALSGSEKVHNGYFKVEALLGERGEK